MCQYSYVDYFPVAEDPCGLVWPAYDGPPLRVAALVATPTMLRSVTGPGDAGLALDVALCDPDTGAMVASRQLLVVRHLAALLPELAAEAEEEVAVVRARLAGLPAEVGEDAS